MAIATSAGNAFAASAGVSGFTTGFTSHAEAIPGQATGSAGGGQTSTTLGVGTSALLVTTVV